MLPDRSDYPDFGAWLDAVADTWECNRAPMTRQDYARLAIIRYQDAQMGTTLTPIPS